MKFWKKTLSAGLALTLCAGMVVPALAADFTDLQAAIDAGPFDSGAVPTEPSETRDNGTAFETDDGIRYGYGWNEAAKGSASKGWDIWAWDSTDGATRNIQLNENVEFSKRDKKKESAKDKTDTQAGIVIGAGKNVSIDLNGKDIDLNPGSVLDVEAGKFYQAGRVDGEKVAATGENGEKTVTAACNNISKNNSGGLQTGSVIRVEENGTLTLNDGSSGGDGSITGGLGAFSSSSNWNTNAGGIYNKGTLTMNGGAIEGNYATYGGGVYSAGENAKFTMNGGAIQGNKAMYRGGGVYNDNGTLQMKDGVIQSNAVGETIGSVGSGYTGGGVYNKGTFTMDGGAIQSNKAGAGGGVGNYGTFTMNDGTISGNEASWRVNTGGEYGGGGVENRVYFTMNGGTIENNKANYGGGVRNQSAGGYATFTMNGGVIKNNSNYDDSRKSSGLGVYNGNKFIMSGSAVISGNKTNGQATSGGGVANRGNFAMSGNSAILDNEATVGGGVSNTGDFTMKDEAAIYKNTANKQGGGVSNTGDFTMKDKTAIRNNTANGNGGGVYMSKGASSSDFNMEGDSAVYGNTANGDGGGVYVDYKEHYSGNAYMKGNSSIYNNTADGVGGGVYISGAAVGKNGGYFTMGDKDNPESGAPTVYGNTAKTGLGSGVYASGGYLYMYGSSAIRDNAEGEAGRDIYAESNAKLNLGDSKWTVDTAESRENGENEKFDPEKAEQGANIGLKFGYTESNPSTPVTPVTPVTPGGDLGYDGGDAGDEGLEIDDPLVPLASGPVTRAQFLDYLWRHEGEPASSGACTFTDAPADHEFILALSWAEQNGIAKAYEDGTFQPDELVTVAAVREFLGSFASVFGGNAVAVADLTTLTGADDEAVVNCDQVLAEFFGEEYVLPEDVDGLEVDIAA